MTRPVPSFTRAGARVQIPRIFGDHEVFHALVILASVCHFVSVVRIVDASR